jgi:hypothetical protein
MSFRFIYVIIYDRISFFLCLSNILVCDFPVECFPVENCAVGLASPSISSEKKHGFKDVI